MIEGIIPCRPEVREIIESLAAHFDDDELDDGMPFSFEQDMENPNFFMVCVIDDDNYANVGLLGWNEAESKISFYCHNPRTENHDVAEGVNADDSKCWWSAPTLEIFTLHLDGGVREIINENMFKNA